MPSRDDPIRSRFGSLVAQVARRWRRAADRHLQPFGLTEATWLPLVYIARADAPMRQKELAATLSLDGSSLVRLLDNLETAGLIRREEDPDDRRAKAIVLTGPGRETAGRVEAAARRVREEALAGLTDEEVATAFRVLEHASAALAPAATDAAT